VLRTPTTQTFLRKQNAHCQQVLSFLIQDMLQRSRTRLVRPDLDVERLQLTLESRLFSM